MQNGFQFVRAGIEDFALHWANTHKMGRPEKVKISPGTALSLVTEVSAAS